MKCKYCGGKVSFFADYCPSCGKKTLEDTKKEIELKGGKERKTGKRKRKRV